ncbi:MAG: autotransporter domain-containing protein [Betaproteobacteria bacterium]
MSLKKRLIPALVGATLAFGATAANAISFNGVYIFGDSLSDAGYYRPGLAALVGPTAAAGLGKFTTNPGPVWSELIAQYYGGNPAASNAGGGIYAQGGMQAIGNAPASRLGPGGTQRPASAQINEYLASSGGVANPNALYGVWFGANDVFTQLEALSAGQISAATLQSNVLGAASAEVAQIARLQAAGARYILAFALPDIGATPAFATNPLASTVTALGAGYNTTLFTSLKSSNIKVIPVDTFTLLGEIRANPSAYGFTNITTPACQPVGTSSLTCSAANIPTGAATSYLFADPVHPTTAAHAIIADFVKSLIDGPNAYSLMGEIPLSTRAAHIRTLDEGLRQGQSANIGRLSAFAAGEGSKYDISTNPLSPSADTKNRAATVGLTMRASEAVTLGVAVGSTKGDARMGVGQFDIDETALSVFGSARAGGWYANFVGSFADVKYDNIRRFVKLGLVTRTATANTKGSNASGSLTGGYDFQFGRITIGPFISTTNQVVTVNAFTEDGAGSANLNIFEQSRRSRIFSGGARASMNFGNWTPFARVSMDREDIKGERFVSANPVSIVAGNAYDIPAYKPDTSWITSSIGVQAKLAERVGLSVVYTGVSSKSDVKQDGVTASVSFDF